MTARSQLTFEAEPVTGHWSPRGDVIVARKDVGGSEFFQLYTLQSGQAAPADGRQEPQRAGRLEQGRHADRLFIDTAQRHGQRPVRDAIRAIRRLTGASRRCRAAAGSFWISRRTADGSHRQPAVDHQLGPLPARSCAAAVPRPSADPSRDIAYGVARFAPDGKLWVTSDEGADFLRLGVIDPASGKFTVVSPRAALGHRGLRHRGRWQLHRLQRQRGRCQSREGTRSEDARPCVR